MRRFLAIDQREEVRAGILASDLEPLELYQSDLAVDYSHPDPRGP